MYKQLLSATAIALALGLQGCGTLPTAPKVDAEGSFADAGKPGAKGHVAEKVGVADAALAAGDSASAIRMYRELSREFPLSIEPRIKLGAALLAVNAPQEAARAYEGANKINPTYDGVNGLGRVYLALRQPAEALRQFDHAAQIRPGDATAMNGQGVALDQLGKHVEAQKVYLAVLDKDPSNIKVRSNYALSLAFAGKYDEAVDILNSLAQVPDSDDRIRQNLALVYGLAGNPGQAAHFGRMDLDEDAVKSNLKYYGAIRNLNSQVDKAGAMTRPTAKAVPSETGPFDAAQAKPSSQVVATKQGEPAAQASSAPAQTIAAPATRNTHAAEKPVIGMAGIRPVIATNIEPAKSSSPAEAKAPTDAELAEILAPAEAATKNESKPKAKVASHSKHASLASLPMTRAEAAALQAPEAMMGNNDDLVPVVEKPASKPTPQADKQAAATNASGSPVTVSIATYAPLAEDLKPVAAKAEAPSRSHGPAVPQASAGVTASIPSNAAVPAVGAAAKTSKPARKHNAVSAATTLEANPVDTGTRAPAVPAVL